MQHSHKRTWCPVPLASIAFGAEKIREKTTPRTKDHQAATNQEGRNTHQQLVTGLCSPDCCLLPTPRDQPWHPSRLLFTHPLLWSNPALPACSGKTGLTAPPSRHFHHGASCETRGSGAGRSLAGAAAPQDSWLSLSAELQHCCPHPGTSSTHGQSITTHPQPHPCGKPPRGSSATKSLTQS